MTESFLHYIWQYQYFNKEALQTTTGEHVQVFSPGIKNTHAGPDFSDVRIKIDSIEWRGSVEIHIHASGWSQHHHDEDRAYEKVVLHVVWENDKPVMRTDGTLMPTIELKNRVDLDLWNRYKRLFTSTETIPCATQWRRVPEIMKLSMLDKAVVQRMENKSIAVHELLKGTGNNWEEVCYQMICKNFGFKVNTDAMAALSSVLPYKILLKHLDKQEQIEALMMGVAGFLEEAPSEEYVNLLQREFSLLRAKYALQSKQMHKSQWRFLRLRPANFPTVRIAQLASLLIREKNLFSKILECNSFEDFVSIFKVTQSSYWQSHYVFGKISNAKVPALGKTSIYSLLINTVVPLLVAYGKTYDDQRYIERALELLHHVPGEQNNITKQWIALGSRVKTSFESQGFIELYNNFCLKRVCLECSVGSYLVKQP